MRVSTDLYQLAKIIYVEDTWDSERLSTPGESMVQQLMESGIRGVFQDGSTKYYMALLIISSLEFVVVFFFYK